MTGRPTCRQAYPTSLNGKNCAKQCLSGVQRQIPLGLANGLMGLLMAALMAEFHTFLALLLTALAVVIGFTATRLKPAMDRIAIYSSE